jgi:8-oxo-dGTP pyrophosphatase MutT (NUDIX family)
MYVVNVEGAILRDDRYLLVVRGPGEDHAPGTLALVGGKVEQAGITDAILENTLRREISEEVGVEVGPLLHYLKSSAFVADDGAPVVDVVFLCEYVGGTPRIADPDEVAAIEWLTAAEVLGHPKAPPWTRLSIEAAERHRERLRAKG